MTSPTKRLINFLKTRYRDDPEGFRALLPESSDAAVGPLPTDAPNLASDLSDDELAYHRDRLASALRELRGSEGQESTQGG